MKLQRKAAFIGVLAMVGLGLAVITTSTQLRPNIPGGPPVRNPDGPVTTVSTAGQIDLTNPFFQNLGTNGRSCATCHQLDDGMSITPAHLRDRFDQTSGLDPVFRTNDGSNCDHNINVSTLAGREQAYSLLLSRGLIRVALPVPDGAEFEVLGVNNPYGCGETTTLSMYRRPLPATNLRFLSDVMWDGRESNPPSTQKISFYTNAADLGMDLGHQALDATNGHAQAAFPLNAGQEQAIVAFESSLYTANAGGAGGPGALANQPFYIGINDSFGLNPKGTAFTRTAFTIFNSSSNRGLQGDIARGESLFNTRPMDIRGVDGLNDVLNNPSITGTCSTCHDSPNVGNHSISRLLNIGVSNPGGPLNANYLPVMTLRNKRTREIVRTTDPGRAMVTGQWEDVAKMKVPVLRGLAGRAPYFHNGGAATLPEVIEFYNRRFNIRLSPQERADLVAFLGSL